MINVDDIRRLLNSSIPDATLAKETGLTRQTINNLRNGRRSLEGMSIKTASVIQKYCDEYVSYSFECSEVLSEAIEDYDEFGDVKVAGVLDDVKGHEVIVDYFIFGEDDVDRAFNENVKVKLMMMSNLIAALKEQNEL